ncbi:PREDICTED: uncharacterized protein LOC106813918 [Priapulus caudatus]|uniref:Uncharacterized protein LOC106813918 n=1 Tax=Priapulus caudatus TaxID=37621 RepID=A0ABM1EN77_PRICU|nr:PREDICTED: uncharacterized protein LOC106813918 [Priapulus caudatus]
MLQSAVTVWGTAAAPSIKLRLYEGTSISNKAKQATYVDLGQDLLLVASLDDVGLYTNFILYNCVAFAPDSQYSMVLIDSHDNMNITRETSHSPCDDGEDWENELQAALSQVSTRSNNAGRRPHEQATARDVQEEPPHKRYCEPTAAATPPPPTADDGCATQSTRNAPATLCTQCTLCPCRRRVQATPPVATVRPCVTAAPVTTATTAAGAVATAAAATAAVAVRVQQTTQTIYSRPNCRPAHATPSLTFGASGEQVAYNSWDHYRDDVMKFWHLNPGFTVVHMQNDHLALKVVPVEAAPRAGLSWENQHRPAHLVEDEAWMVSDDEDAEEEEERRFYSGYR